MTGRRIQHRRQHGAALFLALTFLLLLTILAVTASSTSIMQERMVGGMRNRQLGLIGAENTLRGGEEALWNLNFSNLRQPFPPCVGNPTNVACAMKLERNGTLSTWAQTFRTSRTWLDPANDGARSYSRSMTGLTGDQITANLATQPRFIVESLGTISPGGKGGQEGFSQRHKGDASAGKLVMYRITARSQGGTDSVIRVAESYYAAIDLSSTGFNPDVTP
jgi:type IV pilus assembly protein PilX